MLNYIGSDPKDVELEALITRLVRPIENHVHVTVRDGKVSLSGSADDYATKRRIYSLVHGIGGVREVTNHIRVA